MSNQTLKKLLLALILIFLANGLSILETAQQPVSEEKHMSNDQCIKRYLDHRLDFSTNLIITDDALIRSLKTVKRKIMFLDLNDCTKLSDNAIEAIVKKWPKLQEILLSGCTGLTNQTLLHINKHCRELKSLSLAKCRNIQDYTALEALVRQNKNLKYLYLSKTPFASPTIKNALITINSTLEIDIGNIDRCIVA